ncbi:MAG: acetolactate synthase 2 catalytic subunit [Pirellulales bacterium]|nr:acetolactate synthase 2 catalytic subunit [Pirellulales bacterium]
MNGAQLLVSCLEREGVEEVWGYPGGAIMPVYDALLGSGIKHYLTRHEQGAAFAAQGFARSTGRVGVCMATSGPGATNLVTGIADAHLDSIPLVAITGQVPRPLMGTDAFQEVDIFGISLPIVKHSYLVEDVDDIPAIVHEAFELAQQGRPGPVLIDFPKDVSLAKAQARPLAKSVEQSRPSTPEAVSLARARELLREAKQPIVYAGGGVPKAGAVEALRDFVHVTKIPVVHTLQGLGSIPGDHELFLGMLGMHGTKAANRAVQECDLLVAVGVRFDDRATGKLAEFAPNASVIHMDIDPAELSKLREANVALRGDIVNALGALTVPLEIDPWRNCCLEYKRDGVFNYDAPFEVIYAPKLLHDLAQAASEDTYICCDVGQHQMWVAQHYSFSHPSRHLTSGGLGTMGFGLPAAIGVQCAHPDATVINVSGDGSIMMNIQELATIRRYNLPVKVLLFDNSALGMVRQWQELFFHNRESEVDLSDNPDFRTVAEAFGIPARHVSRADETEEAIHMLCHEPGPLFIHAHIDRRANVWPLVPPNANNGQMMHEPAPAQAK